MKKIVLSVLLVAGFCLTAQAANDSWKANADGSWNVATNWTGGNIPGSTLLSNSADIATFSTTLTAPRTVTVDANRNIGGITFGNTSTNFYTLTGGNLLLSDGGVIQTVTGTGVHNDTIASAITVVGDGGSATFRNDSVGSTAGLKISGDIAGSATAGKTTTITFDGVSTTLTLSSANNSWSVITDGTGGGKVAVVKNGTGVWTFGMGGTFSGGMTINAGTIRYFGGGSHGFGTGTVTINGNVSFYRGNSTANTMTNPLVLNGNLEVKANVGGTWSGPINLNGGVRTFTATSSYDLTGVISNGGLIKMGASILTISNANTYALGTIISNGTLVAAMDGALGASNITVAAAATLTLTNGVLNDYIGKNAKLILNSTSILNLGYIGTDTIGGLSLDGGTTMLPRGTYTAAQLFALNPSGVYSGGGSLTVGSKAFRLISITSP